jgi:hypothetical protein
MVTAILITMPQKAVFCVVHFFVASYGRQMSNDEHINFSFVIFGV